MEILESFGIQPILLAAQVVNFLVLLWVLQRFAYKPILKVLETRKQTIADSLKNAEEIEKRLQKTEEDREKRLQKAADEAREILDDATKTAAQIMEEAQEKGRQQMEEIVEKGRQTLQAEQEKLHQEIRQEVATIVVTALEKVTGKVLTPADQKKLVNQSLKDL